jgi:hypothetical protein
MDDENVSILDPSWENEEKVFRVKVADFEIARLANRTDQSCIFVDWISMKNIKITILELLNWSSKSIIFLIIFNNHSI